MPVQSFPIVIHDLFYREATQSYHVPAHTLKTMQWYCVIHGSVEQRIDHKAFPLRSMESLLIPAHAIREPRARAKSVAYIVCTFENQRLALDTITARTLPCPAMLRGELQALVSELRAPASPERQELLQLLLPRIFIGLRRDARVKSAGATPEAGATPLNWSGHQAVAAEIENYMRKNLHSPLTRDDLAAVAHFSPSHLARVFRAATGKSLLERLTELRIAQACAMLGESSLPITRIALDVGFNSFSHFTTLFKRNVGISPSDYRRSGGRSWNAQARK